MGGSRGFRRKAMKAFGIPEGMTEQESMTSLLCQIHFAGIRDVDLYTCEKCADFKSQQCLGEGLSGEGCMECMWNQAGSGNLVMGGNL
jgi:hypothetical protein